MAMKTANKDEKKRILDGLSDLFRQNRRWFLFFGTGTSCALDERFGMPALQDYLSKELAGNCDWAKVKKELANGNTLERALTGIGPSEEAKKKFRQITGDFIAQIDQVYRDALLLGKEVWVGTQLLKALVGRLPPKNPRLPVITSNYDMLIEYACSVLGIRYLTGFVGEITKSWNWSSAQDSLNRWYAGPGGRRGTVQKPIPRVELFKVHGSINRFTNKDQQIECDLWTFNPPSNLERDVAVPGDQKYEQIAYNIDTAYKAGDMADEASAFLIIGYGFNDPHLHKRIMARIQGQDCPLVVLTLDLDLESAEIVKIRNLGTRVWILVAPRLAQNGNDTSKTTVYMPGETDGFILDDEKLWSCDVFAERVLGG
jgi:hypothetical protein